MVNSEVGGFYNRFFVEGIEKRGLGNYLVTAEVPQSVTCPDLPHLSPSDFTLTIMQASATAALKEYPVHYPNVLFLSHRAQYLDQDQPNLNLQCILKAPRSGTLRVLNIDLEDQGKFEGQLLGGIVQEMPQPVIEDFEPRGVKINEDQISEVLSIYSGINQSDVVAVGFDNDNGVFEAGIYFPPYAEMAAIAEDHVSARQMIEALMKVAYCGAAHLASTGRLPLTYKQLLANRLRFRTRQHDLRYRKLLAPGTKSLLRFQLTIEENKANVIFTHRPNASKAEESFATGRMTFYLPEEQVI